MHTLHLPRLGQTMERGTIERWLVRVGQAFEIGEPLYVVETEKVNVEVEAKLAGSLARLVVAEGSEVPVGALLAMVTAPGENVSDAAIDAAIAADRRPATPPAPARQDHPAGAPAPAPAKPGARVRAMPRARARALELGLDLSTLSGSGSDGAITVDDVERAAGGREDPGDRPRVRARQPLSGVARTMADVVSRSWREIPQFVQQISVDAGALMERRRRDGPGLAETSGVSLSYTVLLLEAIVRAIAAAPGVNASWAENAIVEYEDVNISVAVAGPTGLVVPVIRRAQACSRVDLARQLHDLAGRARRGRLRPEDVAGGTITLSNLGMYGVETGIPLVTAPQAAVVFAGAIGDRPAVVNGSLAVRPILQLAIAYDHRVVDGVRAAAFTGALKSFIEDGDATALHASPV
jgi:pyruvate dehydrogenase E2 component (dihydrolipoamide acetyltransferase)